MFYVTIIQFLLLFLLAQTLHLTHMDLVVAVKYINQHTHTNPESSISHYRDEQRVL